MILFVSALKIWIHLTSNNIDKTRWLSGWEAQVRGNAALGTDSRGLCYGILWLRVFLDNQSGASIPFCDRMFQQHNTSGQSGMYTQGKKMTQSSWAAKGTQWRCCSVSWCISHKNLRIHEYLFNLTDFNQVFNGKMNSITNITHASKENLISFIHFSEKKFFSPWSLKYTGSESVDR